MYSKELVIVNYMWGQSSALSLLIKDESSTAECQECSAV